MSYLRRVKPLAHQGERVMGVWRLHQVIGYGRHSIVYLARHLHDGSRAALKVARQGTLAEERAVTMACAHRNVVRVVGHGKEAGVGFLALEHAGRGALPRSWAQRTPEEAVRLLRDAASALAHVHALGFVHGDVKPANLLRRGDGDLVLADFGCARPAGTLARPDGPPPGSPLYAAPEYVAGVPMTPGVDVYALGILFYEWLCGHPAFNGETASEIQAQHLAAPVPRLPAALARWQALVDALLAKQAPQRLAHASEVLAALSSA